MRNRRLSFELKPQKLLRVIFLLKIEIQMVLICIYDNYIITSKVLKSKYIIASQTQDHQICKYTIIISISWKKNPLF